MTTSVGQFEMKRRKKKQQQKLYKIFLMVDSLKKYKRNEEFKTKNYGNISTNFWKSFRTQMQGIWKKKLKQFRA